jgi:hypothetical protein
LSAGISTPNSLGISKNADLWLLTSGYPCRCLCRGFLQITRTTFFRFTILHASQSLFTDGRTFINSIVDLTKNPEAISGRHFWRKVIRPFDKS